MPGGGGFLGVPVGAAWGSHPHQFHPTRSRLTWHATCFKVGVSFGAAPMPDTPNEVHHPLKSPIEPFEKDVQDAFPIQGDTTPWAQSDLERLNEPIFNPAGDPGPIPTLAPTVRRQAPPKKLLLSQTILGTDAGVRALLHEMRSRSGVSFRMLAKRMGVVTEDVKQYFNGKRGSSRTSIGFLTRFAEACGCRIEVKFPDRSDE